MKGYIDDAEVGSPVARTRASLKLSSSLSRHPIIAKPEDDRKNKLLKYTDHSDAGHYPTTDRYKTMDIFFDNDKGPCSVSTFHSEKIPQKSTTTIESKPTLECTNKIISKIKSQEPLTDTQTMSESISIDASDMLTIIFMGEHIELLSTSTSKSVGKRTSGTDSGDYDHALWTTPSIKSLEKTTSDTNSDDNDFNYLEDDGSSKFRSSRSTSFNVDSMEPMAGEVKMKFSAQNDDDHYRISVEKRLRPKHNAACKLLKGGKLEDAEAAFEDILCILVEEYGLKHQRVATALHNLGVVHLRCGNFEDAADAVGEAIRIRKKILGDYHPLVADSLVELGVTLMSQDENDDGIEIFHEALAMREREASTLEPDKQDRVDNQVAKILNNLGCAYFQLGDFECAKESFQEALAIQRESFEGFDFSGMPGFLATSSTICNLGYVHMEEGDWEASIFQFEEALKIQRNVLEASHQTLVTTLRNLSYACVKYGGFDKALQYYTNILHAVKQTHGEFALELAEAMRNIVYCEFKLFKFDDVGTSLKKMYAIYAAHLQPDDERLREVHTLMASLCVKLLEFPSLTELISNTITVSGFRHPWNNDLLCECGYDIELEEHNLDFFKPKRPPTKTKLSGNRVTYA